MQATAKKDIALNNTRTGLVYASKDYILHVGSDLLEYFGAFPQLVFRILDGKIIKLDTFKVSLKSNEIR